MNIKIWLMATLTFFSQAAFPCSSFRIPAAENAVFAKSYDWHMGQAHVLVNKRNVEKKSLAISAEDNSMTWTSQYGSLTFNQYGREFPLGGINESGLSIEVLWLNESEYPKPDNRKSFNELQWIQYLLDTTPNVSHMITKARSIRISPIQANIHFLACDKSKVCATFEYLGGDLIIHSNIEGESQLPYPTITNNTYADSLAYLKQHQGFGGKKALPVGGSSLDRFVRATSLAQGFTMRQDTAMTYAFDVLDSVATGTYSKWNIVYDLTEGQITFKTRFGNTDKKWISMNDFDFSCKKPTLFVDIESAKSGAIINDFKEQSFDDNKRLVNSAMKEFPEMFKWLVYNYPQSTTCKE